MRVDGATGAIHQTGKLIVEHLRLRSPLIVLLLGNGLFLFVIKVECTRAVLLV